MIMRMNGDAQLMSCRNCSSFLGIIDDNLFENCRLMARAVSIACSLSAISFCLSMTFAKACSGFSAPAGFCANFTMRLMSSLSVFFSSFASMPFSFLNDCGIAFVETIVIARFGDK